MELLKENSNGAPEKHIPVLEIKEGSVKVKIGKVPHPMTDEHYIEWIEILADDKVYRKYLSPTIHPKLNLKFKPKK